MGPTAPTTTGQEAGSPAAGSSWLRSRDQWFLCGSSFRLRGQPRAEGQGGQKTGSIEAVAGPSGSGHFLQRKLEARAVLRLTLSSGKRKAEGQRARWEPPSAAPLQASLLPPGLKSGCRLLVTDDGHRGHPAAVAEQGHPPQATSQHLPHGKRAGLSPVQLGPCKEPWQALLTLPWNLYKIPKQEQKWVRKQEVKTGEMKRSFLRVKRALKPKKLNWKKWLWDLELREVAGHQRDMRRPAVLCSPLSLRIREAGGPLPQLQHVVDARPGGARDLGERSNATERFVSSNFVYRWDGFSIKTYLH